MGIHFPLFLYLTGWSTLLTSHSQRQSVRERGDDGNCFFRAVARQVLGDPEQHAHARSAICDHMSRLRIEFEPFIDHDSDGGWDAYLARQRQSGCWGGELEMKAAAEVFGRALYAYQPQSGSAAPSELVVTVHRAQGEGVLFSPVDKVPTPAASDICLWFEGGNHWNSLAAESNPSKSSPKL
jgi:hypothetical protein